MTEICEIGIIKNKFSEPANPAEIKKHESIIKIRKEFQEGLFKIEDSEYIDVIFHFHLSNGYKLKGPIFTGEVKGIFASRSPNRPTPIGVTTAKLIERTGRKLRVTGLDAIDGTPVLDIKPHMSYFTQPENQKIQENDLKTNPRMEIISHIWAGETEQLLLKAGQLHGHFCPGLAMGVMAGTYAMQEIRETSDGMEDLLSIVETNNCFSDGIQFVTGCSFGNNSFIFRDLGKTAFILTKRDRKGIRISTRPESKEYIRNTYPLFSKSYKKVVQEQDHSDEEIAIFKKRGIEKAFVALKLDFNKIFKVGKVKVNLPAYAPSHESIVCNKCGESIMCTRVVKKAGKQMCLACAGENYFQLDGEGIREEWSA